MYIEKIGHVIFNVCWCEKCPRITLSHGMSHDDLALSVHIRIYCGLAQQLCQEFVFERPTDRIEFVKAFFIVLLLSC